MSDYLQSLCEGIVSTQQSPRVLDKKLTRMFIEGYSVLRSYWNGKYTFSRALNRFRFKEKRMFNLLEYKIIDS